MLKNSIIKFSRKFRNQESLNKGGNGAGEMVQWLLTLATFPEDLGSISSNDKAVHNCL